MNILSYTENSKWFLKHMGKGGYIPFEARYRASLTQEPDEQPATQNGDCHLKSDKAKKTKGKKSRV